jgi:hypothetical protein
VSAALIGLLAFLLGTSAGGSDNGSLRADLSAARAEARSATSGAEADVTRLEDEVAELEDRLTEARAENGALQRRVTRMNARRELPDLVGMMKMKALDLEAAFGWNGTIEYRFATAPAGTILSQRPAPGTMMRYGAPYSLVVAKPLPQVGDVVGMWRAEAERSLDRWNVVVVEEISDAKPGRVIRMTPGAGTRVMPGATVTLVVAVKAPPPPPVAEQAPAAGCTPGYSPCLPPASDYDCSGGSGDGPKYTGYVTVTGSDPYGLDADGDGAGCES